MKTGTQVINFSISAKSESVFDSVFTRNGLPLAEFPTTEELRALEATNPAMLVGLFVTLENLQIVLSADKVDACLLRHIPAATRADGSIDRSTERYEETAFVPVAAEPAAMLRDLLLSEKSYDWQAGNGGRRPQFYLRLRFHRGDDVVALDFCFMCHVLVVTHRGQELGHANFSPNADLLLQAFLKVFPRDEPLLGLAREAGLPQ